MSLHIQRQGPVTVWTLDRPERRNAVDRHTAEALVTAVAAFEADSHAHVAVLTGAGGHFCAGADLKAMSEEEHRNRLQPEGSAPLGPSRLAVSKPVIAAIAGHAVAGGLELACWCDLRVAERSAVLGVYCRRLGVPLIDGGTARLPRLIGLSHALDLILTGRGVHATEAHSMGLVNRVVDDGTALVAALALAHQLAAFPQTCLRADLVSARAAFDAPLPEALRREFHGGMAVVESGETQAGAARFRAGAGRHGEEVEP